MSSKPSTKQQCKKVRTKKVLDKAGKSCQISKRSTFGQKERTKPPSAFPITLKRSLNSSDTCSELSVRLSPLPKSVVHMYQDASSMENNPEYDNLKSWLNSSAFHHPVDKSHTVEIQAMSNEIVSNVPQYDNLKSWLNSYDSDKPADKSNTVEIQISQERIPKITAKKTAKPFKRKTLKSVEEKTPFSIFTDAITISGSDSSTPASQNHTVATSDAKENLFGFEKLLQPAKCRNLDHCEVSPIVSDMSNRKVRKPLQSIASNSVRKPNKKHSFGKIVQKTTWNYFSPRKANRKRRTAKLSNSKSEVTLFDSGMNFPDEKSNTGTSQFDFLPPTDTASSASDRKTRVVKKKSKAKSKTKRTSVVPFKEQEIAWEEIRNHELVIE